MAATIGRPFITNLGALSFTSFIRTIILTSLGAEIVKSIYHTICTSNKCTHYLSALSITGLVDFIHCPEFQITRKHDVSETGSFSVFM
jgi:hypothetical protein